MYPDIYFLSCKNIIVRYNSTGILYIQHFDDLILQYLFKFDLKYKVSLPPMKTEELASNAIKLNTSELASGNPTLTLSKFFTLLSDIENLLLQSHYGRLKTILSLEPEGN